jgi:heptosyltransferase-3
VTTLVYHAGALGDFIAALPAIAVWRRRARAGRLVLLGRPAHAAIAAVDQAWDAGSARFASLFAGRPSAEVRALLADVGSALVFAPADAGIARGLASAGVPGVVRQDPFPRERIHVVDYHLSLFPDAPLESGERVPRVVPHFDAAPAVAPSDRPIAIHPGSGSAAKNWPLDRFVELARRLSALGPIAWVLGPAEEESGTRAALAAAVPGAPRWRNLPLGELAGRLAAARGFVGNDSGVAHLAAAVGCPVVVLFGASDPAVWQPRGISPVVVVGDGASGMEAIGVEAVMQTARSALGSGVSAADVPPR